MRVKATMCMAFVVLFLAGSVSAAAPSKPIWVGTWASGQQIPEDRNALAPADLTDATLRQIIHTSIGGKAFRVRVSNVFGTEPLTLDAIHLARAIAPGSAVIDPATDRALTFDGRPEVTIPAGAEYVSDPVDVALPAFSNLAVSIHMVLPPARQTSHPGARTTSFLVHGNHLADADLPGAQTFEHWFTLSGVDVVDSHAAGAVVTLGDSITDGRGSTTNGNNRWPDILAGRLATLPDGMKLGVVNTGNGGNRVLLDGLGPNAVSRFTRDVLAQSNAKYVIWLEGINDIGTLDPAASDAAHAALIQRVIQGFAQSIRLGREHGVTMIGATILPFSGADYYLKDPRREADRQAINTWIRTPGNFDAVVDFDAVTRDPAQPDRLKAEYDSGDHLHPSAAGYKAMGEAVPLSLFGVGRK